MGCLEGHFQMENNTLLLFERVLPYLVQGLLFGGFPPYIVHITDSQRHEYGKAAKVVFLKLECVTNTNFIDT